MDGCFFLQNKCFEKFKFIGKFWDIIIGVLDKVKFYLMINCVFIMSLCNFFYFLMKFHNVDFVINLLWKKLSHFCIYFN